MKQKILLVLGCLLLASGAWATNYTLTLYADGCDLPNTIICQEGQQLSVSATPMAHRHFVMWNDGNTENPRLVTMNQDEIYTATFENDYTIEVDCSNGYISGVNFNYYKPNDTVSLIATPDFGYHFEQWSDGVTDNPRTIIVTQDSTFVAEMAMNYEGECGENLQWRYGKGLLTISGTGDMYDLSSSSIPWILFRDSIKNVVIEHGATSIGGYAFYGCQNRAFTKVVMPQSVKKIGRYAFADCNRLTSVMFSSELEEVGDYAFSGCTRINDMTCYALISLLFL